MQKKSKIWIFKNGFTLIEILVVISIIGLIASVILISLKDQTKKAEFAKRLTFSASIRHALGANIFGEWTFDDGTAKDSSGNGNDGVISNYQSAVLGVNNKGLVNNAGVSFVRVFLKKSLYSGSLTSETWVKPVDQNKGIGPVFVSRLPDATDLYMLIYGFAVAGHWDFGISRTPENGGACIMPDIGGKFLKANEWNHIVGTFNKNNGEMKLYLNTEIIGIVNCNPGMIIFPSDPLQISVYLGQTWGASANDFTIDEIRLYDSPLSISQIQKLYAEGIKIRKNR